MNSAICLVSLAALAAFGGVSATPIADAQEIVRLTGDPRLPFAPGVMVPAGYDTYYFSGATAAVANPSASKGSFESYGDITVQTRSALDSLKTWLAKFGLTFGDVVQARVFMSADPSKGGGVDFAVMCKAWQTEFGSAEQPNKPARASVEVAGQ